MVKFELRTLRALNAPHWAPDAIVNFAPDAERMVNHREMSLTRENCTDLYIIIDSSMTYDDFTETYRSFYLCSTFAMSVVYTVLYCIEPCYNDTQL